MPRTTKDEEVKKVTSKKVKKSANIEVEEKSTSIKKASKPSKKSTSSKVTTKKSSSSEVSKKTTAKKPAKKASSTKSTTKKSATKNSTVKSTTKRTSSKVSTAKKTSTKKATTKKTSTKRTSTKKVPSVMTMEYYDLPVAYNRTIIKILAQTPSSLFVYWEISEDDRLKLQDQYGQQFFQNTKPHLIITNETMNYSFEVEISDYANSWYIHINDSDCKYSIKLIRRPINDNISIPISFIDIISSNEILTPNDHILFDRLGKTVFFRNIKDNHIIEKDISSLSFISNIGRVYNIYDLYKEIYKNELNGDELGVTLSSSGFSSTFK